jgi:hypothetical protein
MTEDQKNWINNASFETLFRKWRKAPLGDPYLQGECGQYFDKALKEKRKEITDEEYTEISKNLGW